MDEIIKFENDKIIRYKDVNSVLKELIPEFWTDRIHDNATEPHVIFGEFALWLSGLISSSDKDDLVDRSCKLIQNVYRSGDDEVKNLVMVSVLEILVDEAEDIEALKGLFNNEIRSLIDDFSQENL